MIKNYFTVALRILVRQKGYSVINLFGLTLGISCSLLILLYIADELSYDRFHPDAARIYRSSFHGRIQDRDFDAADTGVPMAEALQREVPAVESTLRLTKWGTQPVRFEEKSFTEKHFLLADSNFFEFFSFRLIIGNANQVLKGPNKLVITERAAKKYFGYKGQGDLTPIGKMLVLGSRGEMTVEITGIAADPPHNSQIQFDMILSLASWDVIKQAIWLNSSVQTYFKLRPGASIESVQNQYPKFIEKYCAPEIQQFLNISLNDFQQQGGRIRFDSMPLTDIHLHSKLMGEIEPVGSIQYIYLFSAIAILIILLACINFMNLSTARSANRAKEVGIRKAIGALRGWLVRQFMMESFLYTVLAVSFALLLVMLVLTPFNELTGKELTASMLSRPWFISALIGFTIMVGLVAGSYPAFYLTSFRPAEVLKGKMRAGLRSSGIRNTLVVFQFFISIGLIISTLMVYRQLKFVQEKNLGFEKEHVMNLLHTMRLDKSGKAFKNELLTHPEIISATYSNRLPPNIDWNSTFTVPETNQPHLLSIYIMDEDHLKTMGFQMIKGRFFSADHPSDSNAYIVNETAARQMGYDTYEGKKLNSLFNSSTPVTIECIGIIKDFNFADLHSPIGPLIILPGKQPNWEMAIRLTPGDEAKKLKLVESVWKKYAPDAPFEYSFLDDNYNARFHAEQQMGQIFIVFTSLAIAIACLGLFGLATFTAEQRAKEIGIRKVMGADVPQIVTLLSKDFAILISISLILAVPVTWYGMEKWLQGYAYRVSFDVSIVLVAGGIALLIAMLTISYQSLRAALSNPVQSLKSE
ncbi:MAG: ABC transporter permease [Bacteroidetes bacterium]|nr:ABC transporter permease [Bacteroidota bacterium]